MDLDVDVIEFKVPLENNKTLFVWDILPEYTEAFIYESIWNVFSVFGALYLVKVNPNATVAQPGFYAIVKFYSATQALKAQLATDKTCMFQRSPVKVRLSTKTYPAFSLNVKPLSHAKCQDLANYYLGFNSWSTHIITMKDFSNVSGKLLSEDGSSESCHGASGSQELLLKYGCMVEVNFTHHASRSKGIGVTEKALDGDERPEEVLLARRRLQQWARDKAVVNAMEKVLLLVLSNGKVAIECRVDQDEILPDDDVQGVIKVNDLPWSEYKDGEESGAEDDLFLDLTLHDAE